MLKFRFLNRHLLFLLLRKKYNMSWKTKPIYYDKLTTAERKRLAANKSAYFQKFGKPAKMNIVSGSSTTAQAKRTGGWANPSKGGEVKFLDNAPAGSLTAGVATFTAAVLLNGCVNGSDASTRIGRKITMKSILIRYNAALHASSTGGGNFRVLVVYDKQANATAPAITDILLTDNHLSTNNLSNRDRFTTIFDHMTDQIGVASNYSVQDVLYKRLNFETMFNAGSAGTIGDITSGSVYLFIAQSGNLLTQAVTMNMRVRIRYTDV